MSDISVQKAHIAAKFMTFVQRLQQLGMSGFASLLDSASESDIADMHFALDVLDVQIKRVLK
jgi:hypothetical protein